VISALLVLGDSAERFCTEKQIYLESIAQLSSGLWTPAECPLCASQVTLEEIPCQ
jgi:hypothetical protein